MEYIAAGDDAGAADEEVADVPLSEAEEAALLILMDLFPILVEVED